MEPEGPPPKIRKLSHEYTENAITASSLPYEPFITDPAFDEKIPEIHDTAQIYQRPGSADSGQHEDDAERDKVTADYDHLAGLSTTQPLSKNQQKKLRKKQEWEAGREWRKAKRKAKLKEKRERKRELRKEEVSHLNGNDVPDRNPPQILKTPYRRPVRLPVTFVIDCGFDDKMMEKERISLGSQVTRTYSDNSRAPFQAHLVISSWGGLLRKRFETVLRADHQNWKDIEFTEDDFVVAAQRASEVMRGPGGGRMEGVFRRYTADNEQRPTPHQSLHDPNAAVADNSSDAPQSPNAVATAGNPPLSHSEGETIYLTSDSPNTLTHLSPYSTYIIGGIVDKNRHKGLCYRLACDRGMKTAKLPIGEFMEMQSRFVLATNHVAEIMLRWLACGDWGEAFLQVIPARKGGKLKGQEQQKGEGDTMASNSENEEDARPELEEKVIEDTESVDDLAADGNTEVAEGTD